MDAAPDVVDDFDLLVEVESLLPLDLLKVEPVDLAHVLEKVLNNKISQIIKKMHEPSKKCKKKNKISR